MIALNLLLGAVAVHAVVVSGSSQCPTPATVQVLLGQLLPEQVSEDSVYLEQVDGALKLEMRSAVSGTVFRRQLPTRHTCQQQAAIAATVIAAWQIDSQSAPLATELPPPPPPPALPPPAETAGRPRRSYEVAGAVSGSGAGDSYAIGGLLDALLLPSRKPIALRFGLFGAALRSFPISTGQALWTRAGLRISGGYRFLPESSRRFSLDCFADLSVALVYLTGRGFERVYASFDADVGAGGSIRVGRQLGPVRMFWELGLTGWLRPQVVTAQGSFFRASVPQVEGLLSIGLAGMGARPR